MPNALVVIDGTLPMRLLDVADVLDNQHWKFCIDDPMEDDEDAASYDEFELGPEFIIDAGTVVQIDHLWGFFETGLSEPTNYQITLPKAATVKHVVHVLLSNYHTNLEQIKADGRFLYIEQVSVQNGKVMIDWGT